jgi:hypothetical protein
VSTGLTGNGGIVPMVSENSVRPCDGICERTNRCGGVRRRCGKSGDRARFRYEGSEQPRDVADKSRQIRDS